MSNFRKTERRREIEDLRGAGAAAYRNGASVHTNPHRDADADHWRRGWQEAEFEAAPPPTDDRVEALENDVAALREALAQAFVLISGSRAHASDCATSNAPAMTPGPCDCGTAGDLL